MAANTGRLAGRTIFVSGGSRGIGLAIAKKCARDGANIVLAAKTAAPHPKLPGTIYTAAKEIEDAGGKCLPCIVDIQHEDQIQKAVDETVSKFGGIDILVNNASAINLTGTQATPMKKYDLMMGINTRGTYLCSKLCLPALQKGVNPHILNISPPLNMSAKWFKNHVAYTMAKYGMSMCVLGMSEEFREDGIAVNALWPRTAIWTAAMAMLGGGDAMEAQCRTDAIMADAAYVMLSKDSKQYTGNFAVDDEVLSQEGVKDFEQYACVKEVKVMSMATPCDCNPGCKCTCEGCVCTNSQHGQCPCTPDHCRCPAGASCKCKDKPPEKSSYWKLGAAAVAGTGAVVAAPLVLTGVGFTAAGITAGSMAASMMSAAWSANLGIGAIAVLQSAGAVGLGASATAATAASGAAAGYGVASAFEKVKAKVRGHNRGNEMATDEHDKKNIMFRCCGKKASI